MNNKILVVNLIDDTNLGGVTRDISDTARSMGTEYDIRIVYVETKWKFPSRIDADVIIVDFTPSWAKLFYLIMLRLISPCPVIIVEHSYTRSSEKLFVKNKFRFRNILRISFFTAKRVVAVSYGQASWLRDEWLVLKNRLVIIPQSLYLGRILAISPAKRLPVPLRIGAYGRYVKQKGFDALIQAMNLLPPQCRTFDNGGL